MKAWALISVLFLVGRFSYADNITHLENRDQILWDVSAMAASYNYKEPGLMQINGNLTGFILGTTIPHGEQNFFKISGDWMGGRTTYEGLFLETREPTGKILENDYMYTLSATYGVKLALRDNKFMDISGGLGRRYLKNNNSSYDREQTYLYLPLGWGVNFGDGIVTRWRVGLDWNIFLSGKNISHLEQVDPDFQALEFNQNKGSGAKISVTLESTRWGRPVLAQIFQQTWSIEDSDVQTLTTVNGATVVNAKTEKPYRFIEPKNRTRTFGVSVGTRF